MQYNSREPGAPAEAGGVPLCVPHLGGNEWAYIKECLDTNFVSSVGPFVNRFERSLAARVGTNFAVATVNGTAALHVALQIAGVRRDEEVLVSTLSFIAPANAIRYLGAVPIFIDAEPVYWQMNPARVTEFLESSCERRNGLVYNRATHRRIAAIMPVHILGHPVDLDPVLTIARELGLPVIEDATESLGALYRGRPVGHLGDIACFSFNGNKLITSGGGGMIVTDNEEWARRAKYLTTQAKDDAVEFVHGEVGYNYRLTNVLAALGVAQMERLDEHLLAKRHIADRYVDGLADLPGIAPMREAPWARSAQWLFTVRIDDRTFPGGSRAVMHALDAAGIQTRPLWQPLHQSPSQAEAPRMDCPVAEELNHQALSLPCSVGLTNDEQSRVLDAVHALATSRHASA